MQLVYLSPVPWESFAQRPHKFVEWFHGRGDGQVLWVDPYPTRLPNWSDFSRSKKFPVTKHSSVTPEWLTVLKPMVMPIEPLPGSGYVNRRLWQHLLRRIIDFASHSETWLVIGKPSAMASELVALLKHCPSLYDAMDDFPAFYRGCSGVALERSERKIVQLVDVIWASSTELESRWLRSRKDVRLVHNGLDLSAVLSVVRPPIPSDNKVFGYVGTIASWFDWEWVCRLAKSRPNDEVRLVGPVCDRPNCNLPSNVRLLPACHHTAALEAMSRFSVGLIPFRKNALTASVDPIKYYEYRSMGLPIIATNFGEMRFRSGERGVFITHFEDDLPAMAEAAMQFESERNEALNFSRQNAWEVRFDTAGLFNCTQ